MEDNLTIINTENDTSSPTVCHSLYFKINDGEPVEFAVIPGDEDFILRISDYPMSDKHYQVMLSDKAGNRFLLYSRPKQNDIKDEL